MALSTQYTIFPICHTCEAVHYSGKEPLLDLDGKVVKTVKKKFFCGGCKDITYCSVSCQRKDWKQHRNTCEKSPFNQRLLLKTIAVYFAKMLQSQQVESCEDLQLKLQIGQAKMILQPQGYAGAVVKEGLYDVMGSQLYMTFKQGDGSNDKLRVKMLLPKDTPTEARQIVLGQYKFKVCKNEAVASIAAAPKAVASPIVVYQREWAFTVGDSEKPVIKTSSASICLILSITHGKYAALAHIDADTDISSISQITDRFNQFDIPTEELKVEVLGGWKTHNVSSARGEELLKTLESLGIHDVKTDRMYIKKSYGPFEYAAGVDPEIAHHFHLENVCVNAKTSSTYFDGIDVDIEKEQGDRNAAHERQLTELYGPKGVSTKRIPLAEVKFE